jgi:hypothetical protein
MPKKTIVLFTLLLGLLLAACQSAAPTAVETTQPSATAVPTQTQVAEPTATQAQETQEVASPSEEVISGTAAPPGCTVVSKIPTPGPTERSLFPAVSDEDWTDGPSDAYVTILEYGDFQ